MLITSEKQSTKRILAELPQAWSAYWVVQQLDCCPTSRRGDFCFLCSKIRTWNYFCQCYRYTHLSTAFCFRRCTKLLLETLFFFFNCAISLFLAAIWTKSRVVLVMSMSQDSGKSVGIQMFPSSGEFSANCGEWRFSLPLISVGLSDTLHLPRDTQQLACHPWDVVVNKNWGFFLR